MKLLVIEGDHRLLSSIVQYFRLEAFSSDIAVSYEEGMCRIEEFQYNCIILDINLPGDGWKQLLKFLSENKRREGVIIISTRNSAEDKINALTLGADDYLVKPFQISELNARVRALIRRKYAQGANVLEAGSLQVDLQSRIVLYAGQPVSLSKYEYNLLLLLMINKNRIVSKQAIADHIKAGNPEEYQSPDFVYSHVKNLKKKLKEKGCKEAIHSVYAIGYKITARK
jgi:DNA-binding response OmpR family regulator